MESVEEMPLMLEKLYDALRAGDVPEDKARAAAVEGAEFENQITNIKSDLLVVKWMVGFNLALSIAVLGKLLIGH